MKKILLIIAIVFCIFQIVVIATEFNVGTPAIDRESYLTGRTAVNKNNPASYSGRITCVHIYANTDLTDCEVATFYVVSGDNLSTRDTEYIGAVTAGSKQTFPVNLTVQTGDYIGIWFTGGNLDRTYDAPGSWYKAGDFIPCTDVLFSKGDKGIVSLYGTGTTEVGWPHKWNTKEISKWNIKEIVKWNTIE